MPFVETTRTLRFDSDDADEIMAQEEYHASADLCRMALDRGGRPYGSVRRRQVSCDGEQETWLFELEYSK
jgi:hypothetical protein